MTTMLEKMETEALLTFRETRDDNSIEHLSGFPDPTLKLRDCRGNGMGRTMS